MLGIDLNGDICYLKSSFRFFAENEYHVTRTCDDDVLLLVYEGVLRFSEDGIPYDIHPGEYHIQRHGSYQTADRASDAPKYLYVHFKANWQDAPNTLAKRGVFDYGQLKNKMEDMHALSYSDCPRLIKVTTFYEILTHLYHTETDITLPHQIARFLEEQYHDDLELSVLCERFSFSKNHIINLFKKEFSQTPIAYLNTVRIRKAEQRLIATSDSIETIALECGYANYSHFYRQFIRRNNQSPEQFRHQKRLG